MFWAHLVHFFAPDLESAIYPRSPEKLSGECYFKITVWARGCSVLLDGWLANVYKASTFPMDAAGLCSPLRAMPQGFSLISSRCASLFFPTKNLGSQGHGDHKMRASYSPPFVRVLPLLSRSVTSVLPNLVVSSQPSSTGPLASDSADHSQGDHSPLLESLFSLGFWDTPAPHCPVGLPFPGFLAPLQPLKASSLGIHASPSTCTPRMILLVAAHPPYTGWTSPQHPTQVSPPHSLWMPGSCLRISMTKVYF